MLPISSFDLPKSEVAQAESEGVDPMIGYVFEPNAEVVLDSMLPYYISYQVFQMILDARASEHSARMVAMKNATDNANQFIKDLTLEYNKMRQASITTELLEIATAQMALLVSQFMNKGNIVQIIGPVVDVEFPHGKEVTKNL